MASTTIFIEAPCSWDAVSLSLKQLSRNRAQAVRFAGAPEELDDSPGAIDVLVFSVEGMAQYALEIDGKGMLDLPDDTIGMHLACSIKGNVLIRDALGSDQGLVLRPNGIIERIHFDTEKLQASWVEYGVVDA